ncbi:MAG: DUF6146 family protein [Weeksellaceae bacterium]|nr:DUF6146 family protein [Weeksellaceae bacterium]
MRFFLWLMLATVTIIFTGCRSSLQQTTVPVEQAGLDFEPNEEGEYDLVVFDPAYDVFLASRAMPKNYFSETYYKNRNFFLVTEWNIRVRQPMRFSNDLYVMEINYDPSVNYGIDLEYKLFNFFQFIQWKYGQNLDGRRLQMR